MAGAREEIAQRADDLGAAFVALTLAMPVIVDPRLHVLDIYCGHYGQTPDSPVEIMRTDGTMHSSGSLRAALSRAVDLPGAGLGEDVLAFVVIHGATRLGDDLIQADLLRKDEPLLQFARHLRNACAHGNRWHFTGNEPKTPAALRGRSLDSSLHGQKAVYGWLGPGDYLDFLEDLAALLRSDD